MDFLKEFNNFNNNFNEMPYKSVSEFRVKIESNYKNYVNLMKSNLLQIEKEYDSYKKNFQTTYSEVVALPPKNTSNIIIKKINDIEVQCYIIENYKDALKYPYQPCIFAEVENWYIFAFPELGQILPVTNIENLFEYRNNNKYSKLHYNVFTDVSLTTLQDSDYAVFPYTKIAWEKFSKINKKHWNKILRQHTISSIKLNNNLIPLYTNNCINEISKNITPDKLSTEWSLFVQLYFILFLFRKCAKVENFSF